MSRSEVRQNERTERSYIDYTLGSKVLEALCCALGGVSYEKVTGS